MGIINERQLCVCIYVIHSVRNRDRDTEREGERMRVLVRASLKVYFICPSRKQCIRISAMYTEPNVRPLGRML